MILTAGDHRVTLAPAVGGSIAAWTFGARNVLRPSPADSTDPLEMGCFPLVPFSNRIRAGRFRWGGDEVALPLNVPGTPHALHGVGWQRPWAVISATGAAAVLELRHPPGDWPWAYTARQSFALDAAGLSMTLAVTNDGARAMPCGLGIHPYFARHPDTALRAATTGWWDHDDEIMPTVHHAGPAADLTPWLALGAPVDHVFTGFGGPAELTGGGLTLTMTADAGWLVVYAPPAEDFLCVEPVTHPTDALNMAAAPGIHSIAPGADLVFRARIAVAAA